MNQPEQKSVTPGALLSVNLFGVPVRLHFTFVLLVILLIAIGLEGPSGAQAAIYVLALFLSVLLHELGHALVSRRYGIRTLEIVMFPIGGVARLERNPKPREELWIAIAGPLVNILIAAALIATAVALNGTVHLNTTLDSKDQDMLGQIASGNLVLAIFNLLPAFPMDGGRILRALLALKRSEAAATETAARAGRFLAMLMGIYGLVSANFMLVFVAFFVYLGAVQENASVLGRALTEGVPVREAMITDFRSLEHGQTIRDAANLLLATSQQDFPVVHAGQVIGLMGRTNLLRAMAQEGPDAYVASVMERDFPRLAPETDLAEATRQLAQSGSCGLVMQDDQLIGMLTPENITEYVLLRRLGIVERDQPA